MRLTLLPLIALLLVNPAHAEVVTKSDTGFVVRSSGLTGKTPREAWTVLVTPSGWWDKAHTWSGDSANLTLDPKAGACFCEVLPLPKDAPASARHGSVEHMRVIFADPGKVLRMSGGLGPLQSEALAATLTITLKPVEGGTRILWEYVAAGYMRYKPEEIAPAVDGMIAEQVTRLIARIDAGPAVAAPVARRAPVRAAAPTAAKPTDEASPAAAPVSRPAPKRPARKP